MEHLFHLKSVTIQIFFSLLLCKLVASADDGMMVATTCLSNNQTGLANDDVFQTNVENLLNNLVADGTSLGLYNTSVGTSTDKAYGIYLCRGDATSEVCKSCVTNLTRFLITTTSFSGCHAQFAYGDACMIRYANYSFVGMVDKTVLGPVVLQFVTTNYDEYNQTLGSVVEKVINDAAYNSPTSFASSEASVSSVEKVYALAQCTPDISKGDCDGCLKTAFSDLQRNNSLLKGAWIMLASCQLKYDNTTLNLSAAVASESSAVVSTLLVVIWGLLFLT